MALDLNDKTSNGNNLTNHNTVADSTTTPFAGGNTDSASFTSASSQYLLSSSSSVFDFGTGDFTLECWIQRASSDGLNHGMFSHDTNDTAGWMFYLSTTNVINLYLPVATPTTQLSSVTTITDTNWHHVAVTRASGTCNIYVDVGSGGASDNSNTMTGSVSNATNGVIIGSDRLSLTNFWNGLIDEVRIWNVARTGSQLFNNKNIQLTGNESGLVAYYPFNTLPLIINSNGFMTTNSKFWGT